MVDALTNFLAAGVSLVWGLPLVILLLSTGIVLTVTLGGIQFRAFKHAIDVIRGQFDDPNDPGEISHFQALCTALSATVGLGNIAGVAVAIHLGGPGATFWMIVVGILGMATKFAECTLAVKYRTVDAAGIVHGGPMYYIEKGLGSAFKPLAIFFAIATFSASFGAANMFQTNQVASILFENFSIPKLATGVALALLTAVVIIGGIKRIGEVTSLLVPFMGGIYVLGCLFVILMHVGDVPRLFGLIFADAFTGQAMAGGFFGVLIQGVRRACFSNEAGLGSAPIAHSAAATDEPVREGAVAVLEPFIDTVVICTMTALVILISGAYTEDANGVNLTAIAFDSGIPGFGKYFVPLAVSLFAYSTLLSWSYYGERAVDYLVGEKGILPYKILYCLLAIVGTVGTIEAVINFSDMMLGLMAIPNLIAVLLLLPKLRAETKDYFGRLKSGAMPKNM